MFRIQRGETEGGNEGGKGREGKEGKEENLDYGKGSRLVGRGC